MKKNLYLIFAVTLCMYNATAQQFPQETILAIKYNGEKFNKSMPLEKVEEYHFLKSGVYQDIDAKGLFPITRSGINYKADAYHFLLNKDSVLSFATQIHISNLTDFETLIKANYNADFKPSKVDGIHFLAISAKKYLGWNDKEAILVYTNYEEDYRNYFYLNDEGVDSIYAVVDSMMEAREKLREESLIIDKPAKPAKEKAKDKKKQKEELPPVNMDSDIPPPSWDSEWNNEEVDYAKQEERYRLYDSIYYALSDRWNDEKDAVGKNKQKLAAHNIIKSTLLKSALLPFTKFAGYSTVIDEEAHVNVWLNYNNLFSGLGSSWKYYSFASLLSNNNFNKKESGLITGVNLFFDKTQIRAVQKAFSDDEALNKMMAQVYKSKQSKSLMSVINPDNIAYTSFSINTEAMLHYYYKAMKDYSGYFGIGEYADIFNLYVDLIEIMVDEKGIADLSPGNMVMVLHDLKTKEVTYKDYEYDDDFNQKEITKVKEEISPDFTIAFETRRADFMEKAAKLPLKYAEKLDFDYTQMTEGYYRFQFKEDNPLDALYFFVQKDKVVITTSKEIVDRVKDGRSYTLGKAVSQSITQNNLSMRLNTKKILKSISPELTTDTNRKIKNLLEENLGNATMESFYKKGVAQTNAALDIKGNHANSFEFLFNIINAIHGIVEAEKIDLDEETAMY